MTTFKNEFSWSVSRDSTFRKCQRMYYYQYYGSWGGWNDDADHVVECLKLFFDSNVYKDILQLSSKQWLEVEQFSSF